MRVAAGAVARRVLEGVTIRGALVQIGAHAIDRSRWDWDVVAANPFFCPDPVTALAWEEELAAIRKQGVLGGRGDRGRGGGRAAGGWALRSTPSSMPRSRRR